MNVTREASPDDALVRAKRHLHAPFTYWEAVDPVALMEARLRLLRTLAKAGRPVVLTCRLGLDRSGILALGYLVGLTGDFEEALAAYLDPPPSRLPCAAARSLLARWAETHALPSSVAARRFVDASGPAQTFSAA